MSFAQDAQRDPHFKEQSYKGNAMQRFYKRFPELAPSSTTDIFEEEEDVIGRERDALVKAASRIRSLVHRPPVEREARAELWMINSQVRKEREDGYR